VRELLLKQRRREFILLFNNYDIRLILVYKVAIYINQYLDLKKYSQPNSQNGSLTRLLLFLILKINFSSHLQEEFSILIFTFFENIESSDFRALSSTICRINKSVTGQFC